MSRRWRSGWEHTPPGGTAATCMRLISAVLGAQQRSVALRRRRGGRGQHFAGPMKHRPYARANIASNPYWTVASAAPMESRMRRFCACASLRLETPVYSHPETAPSATLRRRAGVMANLLLDKREAKLDRPPGVFWLPLAITDRHRAISRLGSRRCAEGRRCEPASRSWSWSCRRRSRRRGLHRRSDCRRPARLRAGVDLGGAAERSASAPAPGRARVVTPGTRMTRRKRAKSPFLPFAQRPG